jgi:Fe-S oxidoreductase
MDLNESEKCEAAERMRDQCVHCGLCRKECLFLQRHGTPGELAHSFLSMGNMREGISFECSLCGLCNAVCPVDLHPAEMFLCMRRRNVVSGGYDESRHRALLNYEKRGISQRFTFYGLPPGCRDIIFPGCAVSGGYPSRVLQLYNAMSQTIPGLGLVLDCCMRPSHDLGRQMLFENVFEEMLHYLKGAGVERVWTACPSCLGIFRKYGEGLDTSTVYEYLSQTPLSASGMLNGTVTIHDPCVTRGDGDLHEAVRDLVRRAGLTLFETPHQKEKTVCCGEGGAVHFVAPDLADQWATVRQREAKGTRVVTYCAGCVAQLRATMPTFHVLDCLFDLASVLAGRAKPARSPWTYLNRLWLKSRLKRMRDYRLTRERAL